MHRDDIKQKTMTTQMAQEQLHKNMEVLVNNLGIEKFGIFLINRCFLIIKYIRNILRKSDE